MAETATKEKPKVEVLDEKTLQAQLLKLGISRPEFEILNWLSKLREEVDHTGC